MSEDALINKLVDRLGQRYPTLRQETVASVVHDIHAAFREARIREFVPLLVERRSHAALTELAVSTKPRRAGQPRNTAAAHRSPARMDPAGSM